MLPLHFPPIALALKSVSTIVDVTMRIHPQSTGTVKGDCVEAVCMCESTPNVYDQNL